MSRVLLDTHLLLWWLKADPRLPASLVTELQTDRHSVLISQASLWEMAIKVNLGRLSVDLSALEREVPSQHFQWLPISNEHLLEVAQRRVEPLLLFPCDRTLQAYGSCVRLIV